MSRLKATYYWSSTYDDHAIYSKSLENYTSRWPAKEEILAEIVWISNWTILKILHAHLVFCLNPSCSMFFGSDVIEDETYVHSYEPELKQDSIHWHKNTQAHPRSLMWHSCRKILGENLLGPKGLLTKYKDKMSL